MLFSAVVCVKVTDVERGYSFAPALILQEVVSEPQQRRDGVLCEWKSRHREQECVGSDGVHSLTAKQILHSPHKRKMSHTKQRYRTKNGNGVTGRVFGDFTSKSLLLNWSASSDLLQRPLRSKFEWMKDWQNEKEMPQQTQWTERPLWESDVRKASL